MEERKLEREKKARLRRVKLGQHNERDVKDRQAVQEKFNN